MRRLAGRGAVLAIAGVVAVAAAAVLVAGAPWFAASPAREDAAARALPEPVEPAFTVPTPPPLAVGTARYWWAPVVDQVVARAAPRADARPVVRLETSTPEGTSNIVLVLGRADDESRRLWAHVRLPVLPNGRTGWVPRTALGGYVELDTHLVVARSRLTATLFRNGMPIFRAPVGVGRREWPTPAGNFYIRDKITDFASPFYGPVAFGTSARSAVLTDWPAGGFIGIHGTNQPELLPGRVSHGCIRLRNADIVKLARLMPVGTPLTIR